MVTLDVDSTYSNILLQKTIGNETNALFQNTGRAEGLSKIELRKFYFFLQKNSTFCLAESSESKLIMLPWVHC